LVQVGFIEGREHLFGRDLGWDRFEGLGDADGENPPLMERLAEVGIIDTQITSQ
jgi:hypothetical protein